MASGSVATRKQLSILLEPISSHLSFCTGTCAIPVNHFKLFFAKGNNASWVNLAHTDEDQLKALADACSPATLKRDHEDALDDSHSQVGRLGPDHFATNFNPEHVGLLNTLRSELLNGEEAAKSIRFELHELTLCGEGSHVKADKGPTYNKNIFGSLVIVYPTKHEGGAFVLRYKGQEQTFDSARDVSSAAEPCIGYVAFRKDVQSELLKVTSGHRVALTYHLYLEEEGGSFPPTGPANISSGASTAENLASTFREVFANLLRDPTFLPEGGYLAFGLRHEYHFNPKGQCPAPALAYLKGLDAIIFNVAESIGLEATLKIAYELQDCLVFASRFIEFPVWDYQGDSGGPLEDCKDQADFFSEDFRPHRKNATCEELEEDRINVNWVTEKNKCNKIVQPFFTADGPSSDYCDIDGYMCLVVRVGPPSERTTTS